MKATAVFFSILYFVLTVVFLFLSAASRSAPNWVGQFALGYLLLSLVFLWSGYFYFGRKQQKGPFHLLAIGLACASVSILTTYNIDRYLELRALAKTRIWDVQDQILLSRKGNPIGIRLQYSMLFPKSDYYETGPTLSPMSLAFLPSHGSFSNSIFLMRSVHTTIEPTPHIPTNDSGIRYNGGVAYRFTVDTLPAFLQAVGSELCTTAEEDSAYRAFPEIDARMTTPYKISIGYWFDRSWATQNRYSPKTFYESAAKEDAKHCGN